ncbi:alpha/beta hydrolase-fold protein [uncultured Parasphingorhabdus sp.]|uniref:alpha/beta hydrolase n=1 Tax=uncultured Parasphingorhabdus sp. TaxID=2709694 RepID=UPI0030D9C424
MKFPAIAMALFIIGLSPLHARDSITSEPLTIGTSYLVSTHGVERRVNVVLPADYDKSDKTYPVLIMLDAGLQQDFYLSLGMERWNQLWQRSAPVIFVGVETVDRQRELLPPTGAEAEMERYPTAGESAAFRKWLSASILPLVRGQYRDDGRAFLAGESAAGHFVAETWAVAPALFDGYAALSPSLQWDSQSLSHSLAGMEKQDRPPLFISLADEGGETEEGVLRFVAEAGSNLCFADRRTELAHATTLHGLLPEALQYLLPTKADWLEEYGLTLRCSDKMGD